ncbi:MAG: hypothetical protein H6877_02345 [Rhodobiaceae bacterium]|nr:hypothetical protein [Rhodobiaceae bacterium]
MLADFCADMKPSRRAQRMAGAQGLIILGGNVCDATVPNGRPAIALACLLCLPEPFITIGDEPFEKAQR